MVGGLIALSLPGKICVPILLTPAMHGCKISLRQSQKHVQI